MSFLSHGGICLRALEPQDLETVYSIENDPALWGCSDTSVPYSRYAIRKFISESSSDIYADRQVRLVAERTGGEAVGFADLVNFSPRHLRAEVGIVVFPQFRNMGYATTMLRLLEQYAAAHLLLRNIYAIVAKDNAPAVKLFKAAGFDFKVLLDDWLAHADGYVPAWLCVKAPTLQEWALPQQHVK